jgi:hypothetical protein
MARATMSSFNGKARKQMRLIMGTMKGGKTGGFGVG